MLSAFPSVFLKKECHRTECGCSPRFRAALENVMGKLLCLMGNNIILQNPKILYKKPQKTKKKISAMLCEDSNLNI